MAGRPPAVTDFEILTTVGESIQESEAPVATSTEIVETLPIKREALGRRLNDLAARQLVNRKQVGASYVWWLPEEVLEAVLAVLDADPADASTATATPTDVRQRLGEIFAVGREHFDLELGAVARVDPDADHFRVEFASERWAGFEPGTEFPLSETYCTTATAARGPASVADPESEGIDDITVYLDVGFETYLGTFLDLDEHPRTFFFVSPERREEPFSEADHAFHDLLGRRVKRELDPRSAASV